MCLSAPAYDEELVVGTVRMLREGATEFYTNDLVWGPPAQPKGGVPVERGTGAWRDPSMTSRSASGAVSETRTSLAP